MAFADANKHQIQDRKGLEKGMGGGERYCFECEGHIEIKFRAAKYTLPVAAADNIWRTVHAHLNLQQATECEIWRRVESWHFEVIRSMYVNMG